MSRATDVTVRESGSRERLGWAMLLSTFVIWLGLVIAIPLLASRFLQVSTQPLELAVQANSGTIRVADRDSTGALFTGDPPAEVETPVTVATDAGDAASLMVNEPDEGQLLARLEVYANTMLDTEAAETPRFGISSRDAEMRLRLREGRLRLKLTPTEDRPFVANVETPHGNVRLAEPGNYSVETGNGATQVVVIEGAAQLFAGDESLALAGDERGTIAGDGTLSGPLGTERSLVRNGDFQEGMAGWDELAWNIELSDQPAGATEVIDLDGESALRFERVGEGHADSGVRQIINQDVTDLQSILLEVSLRIVQHSVAVCGSLGSECPLTLRIQYEDINGNDQVWQQGFFASGDAQEAGVPDVCVSCAPPRPEHERITPGLIAFYRVDLLELLPQFGMVAPGRIKNISILSAGHTFDVNVLDVNLIVEE